MDDSHELRNHRSPSSASALAGRERASSPPSINYLLREDRAPANERSVDQQQTPDIVEEIVYPGKLLLSTLTVALMIAIFMIGLDTNIIGEFKNLWLA